MWLRKYPLAATILVDYLRNEGLNYIQYLTKVRMEKAKKMIIEGKYQIKEIALRLVILIRIIFQGCLKIFWRVSFRICHKHQTIQIRRNKMKEFLNDNFLLDNEVSVELYHNHAKKMLIFDYHCHGVPKKSLRTRGIKYN